MSMMYVYFAHHVRGWCGVVQAHNPYGGQNAGEPFAKKEVWSVSECHQNIIRDVQKVKVGRVND